MWLCKVTPVILHGVVSSECGVKGNLDARLLVPGDGVLLDHAHPRDLNERARERERARVCVCERERDRERAGEGERERDIERAG
jgi:hypothetical protein